MEEFPYFYLQLIHLEVLRMTRPKFINSILGNLQTEQGLGQSFFLGLIISASGSLMIGALHLMAIQINVEKGWQAAILFSCGCALVEAIFVRYLAIFTQWISKKKNAMWIMEWILLILFIGLSGICFWTAMTVSDNVQATITPTIAIPTFFLGMMIRFLYPSMIPFWLAWNTVLVTRKIKFKMIPFVIGVGVATVMMHALYIFAGHLVIDFLKDKSQEMMFLIGVLFLVTAFFQARRMNWEQRNIRTFE